MALRRYFAREYGTAEEDIALPRAICFLAFRAVLAIVVVLGSGLLLAWVFGDLFRYG